MSTIKNDTDVSTIYLEKQFEEIDAKVASQPIRPNTFRDILNVTMTANPARTEHTFTVMERMGKASFIRTSSDNVNRVAEIARQESIYSNQVGIDLYIGNDELAEAIRLGEPLEASRALSCRQAIEEELEQLVASGHTHANPYGLINQPLAPIVTNVSGDLTDPAITGAVALKVFTDVYEEMENSSYGLVSPDTLLLPRLVYSHLMWLKMNPGQDNVTVMDELRMRYPNLTIKKWWHAEGAGALGVNRAVMFKNDPEIITHLMARDITRDKFHEVPHEKYTRYIAKTFGVYLKNTTGIRYIEDV